MDHPGTLAQHLHHSCYLMKFFYVEMTIAYGSMLYHTYKASKINPADSLRYE